MQQFQMLKIFDLATAPDDLRDDDDLLVLKPGGATGDHLLLQLRVGDYDSDVDGPSDDCTTREVTFAEYRLHRWLIEHGAIEGETVLLAWKTTATVPV